MTTLIQGGTVVDAEGVRTADVRIDGERVVAVGTNLADADDMVDASGKYVAPGLIDSHVHLMMDGRPDSKSAMEDPPETATVRAVASLRDAVEAGVTTVRDLGTLGNVTFAVKDAVEQGIVPGPRVLACGHNITMTGGHGWQMGREADGPSEVRKAVREQLKAGADVVKCMATGGVLTPGAQIGGAELVPDELEALVTAANQKAVPTAAHAHGELGIKNAVRAGISSIEHGTFMDEEAAALMVEHGTYWVPTASAVYGITENGIEGGIPEEVVGKAEEAAERFERAFDHALDAGVKVAMGTDAGTPFNYFSEIPQEMAYMVERGVPAEMTLRAATVNAADLLGLDDVGLVSEAYVADLVVLDANPAEDATAWQTPDAVFARGEQVV